MVWIYYAWVKSNEFLLITINSVGCITESIYVAIYIVYAHKKARVCILTYLVHWTRFKKPLDVHNFHQWVRLQELNSTPLFSYDTIYVESRHLKVNMLERRAKKGTHASCVSLTIWVEYIKHATFVRGFLVLNMSWFMIFLYLPCRYWLWSFCCYWTSADSGWFLFSPTSLQTGRNEFKFLDG